MKFRQIDNKLDKLFVNDCINSKNYKLFIQEDPVLEKTLESNIFIIEIGYTKIGFIQLTDICFLNKRTNLNIYMVNESNCNNIIAMFKALEYIFCVMKFHKVIIRVFSHNKKMLNIMETYKIQKEGFIDTSEDKRIYQYSILEKEYLHLLKNGVKK